MRVMLGFLVCAFGWPALLLMGGGVEAGFVAGMVALFTSGASAFIGLPLFVWFRERRWLSFWHCLAGGATPGAVFAIWFAGLGGLKAILVFVAIFGVIGAIHGAVFWLVAIFRNDELQEPAALEATEEGQ